MESVVSTSELKELITAGRITGIPRVFRTRRRQQGGGFGNPGNHPYAWALSVHENGRLCQVHSARGKLREWNSLDRMEIWLRMNGINNWEVVNELE